MTPQRRALIDERVAESHRLMLDAAFELNDLVRVAISASKRKDQKIYTPMDPVNEGIRQWSALSRKLVRLAQEVERTSQRLAVLPFDPEGPASDDPPA